MASEQSITERVASQMLHDYHPEWVAYEKILGTRPVFKGTLEEILAQVDAVTKELTQGAPEPNPSVTTRDEKINDDVVVRIYTPNKLTTTGNLPLCFYIHGGGYVSGSLDSEDFMCRFIALHIPCIVVSVDYKLGPRFKFPVMVDDCVAAFNWAWENAENLGATQAKVFTCGASAGGGLALNVANEMISAGNRNRVKGVVSLVPVTLHPHHVPEEYKSGYTSYEANASGVPVITKSTMLTYFDAVNADPKDARVFAALSPNLKHFPPTYISTCEFDPLRDDGVIMEYALQKAGVKTSSDFYPGFPHIFWIFPNIPSAHVFIQNVINGIRFVLE
ncbi:lipase/esterase-like protein [Xylogone sp. PMI_703]|nr:lipase/esterase-like protein [Xylogone sp. PMI_703]